MKEFSLIGKTEQLTTTGVQLITLDNRTDVGDTELGGKKWSGKISEQAYSVWNNYQKATVEFLENNSFKLSHNTGASSANGNGLELPIKIKPDTDYTLSYASIISGVLVYFIQMDSECNKVKETSSKNKQYSFHSEANAEWAILKFCSILNSSYIVNNVQFEEGTVATPYEPYTGGKPSPSPEYLQEIKNVGKWNEEKQKYEVDVKITGKNLLNTYEKAEKDSEFYSVNGDGSLNQKKVDNRSFLTVPETLFLRTGKYYFSLFDTGVTFQLYNADANKVLLVIEKQESVLVDLEKDTNIKYKVFNSSGTANNVRVMVSINKETDYVPCKEPQTLTLTSDRPITKWDKLVEQDGQIGWLYGGEIIESYNSEPIDTEYISSTGELSVGATVLYKLKGAEFVPLPQSEQDAIRALRTYYPTTVITVDGGEVDPDVEVTYIADTKNYIDQKIAAIGKTVVETQKALL